MGTMLSPNRAIRTGFWERSGAWWRARPIAAVIYSIMYSMMLGMIISHTFWIGVKK